LGALNICVPPAGIADRFHRTLLPAERRSRGSRYADRDP
jgi:hypothetical protein